MWTVKQLCVSLGLTERHLKVCFGFSLPGFCRFITGPVECAIGVSVNCYFNANSVYFQAVALGVF